MTAAIFNAIGSRGFHFYLLFQQFINNDVDGISNSSQDPQTAFRSMIIGGPGAYVQYPTCSFLVYLGPKQYMLLLDCRAQRKINQICAPDTYEKCFAAIKRLPDSVEHLIIQLGVPLACTWTSVARLTARPAHGRPRAHAVERLQPACVGREEAPPGFLKQYVAVHRTF